MRSEGVASFYIVIALCCHANRRMFAKIGEKKLFHEAKIADMSEYQAGCVSALLIFVTSTLNVHSGVKPVMVNYSTYKNML